MKALILTALTLLSTHAHADNAAKIFTGKYSVVSGDCHDADRAYISVKTSRTGYSYLDIQFYGQDAANDHVLLGTGERRVPGTTMDSHGEVTETWSTEIDGNILRSTSEISRPSIGLLYQTHTVIERKGNKLTIGHSNPDNQVGNERFKICVLSRN